MAFRGLFWLKLLFSSIEALVFQLECSHFTDPHVFLPSVKCALGMSTKLQVQFDPANILDNPTNPLDNSTRPQKETIKQLLDPLVTQVPY